MIWGYIAFNFIRLFFRVSACVTDCMMMDDAMAGRDLSNSQRHQFNLDIMKSTTVLCCVLWVLKVITSFIEPCADRTVEDASDCMSFMTLLGDILKTGVHLFFVCKHAQTYHQNYKGWIAFLSICKFGERIYGSSSKYDWRHDEYSDNFNAIYFLGVIIKFVLSLAIIVV